MPLTPTPSSNPIAHDPADLLILGGGPAGGAVALGLRKLGYGVTLVTTPRPFRAVEGISLRVVEGLRNAGFRQALQHLPAPTPRSASWNGSNNSANTECLVDRQRLDEGIVADLCAAGVTVIAGRAGQITPLSAGYRVAVETDAGSATLETPFVVEARGRAAPAAGLQRVRGAETVSLLQYWQGEACAPRSAAASFADGWAWMAAWSDGTRYLQLTFDVASAQLPPKGELVAHCNAILERLPSAQPFLAGAEPTGILHARTSTPILCCEAVSERMIRVGDAAMAVDPLSGNGIFQALSSALQAPAVINTLLRQPDNAALAKQFYQQRVEQLFLRFARIGRDFYADEQRWCERPFWHTRRHWPDQQPLHPAIDLSSIRIERLPVVHNGLIEAQEVVTRNDQPLGVWHLNGTPLAPLLRAAQGRQANESVAECLQREAGLEPPQATQLAAWLVQNQWLPGQTG